VVVSSSKPPSKRPLNDSVTRAFLVNDEHFDHTDKTQEEFDFDLYAADYNEVCAAFLDGVLGREDEKIDHEAMIEYLEKNRNIFR
jgi:hypothetical protein